MLIYKVTNTVNGKVYIGKWMGPKVEDRWKQHIRAANNDSGLYFSRAIRKHGPDAFKIEVVHQAKTVEELSEMEKAYIASHQSNDPTRGYNMTLGGDGASPGKLNWMYGRPKTGRLLEGCIKAGRIAGKKRLGQKWPEKSAGRIKLSQYHKEHPPISACEPFRETVVLWLQQMPQLDAATIWKQLQVRGYSGGVQSVRRFVRSLRNESVQERQKREWNAYLAHPNFCLVCGSLIIPRRRDFCSVKARKYCSQICANIVNNRRSAAAAA